MPGAGAPFEWIVGRVCEEFHVLPSQAVQELENEPQRLAETIMLLRSYVSLKDQVEKRIAGKDSAEISESALLKHVLHNLEVVVQEKAKL